MPESSLRFTATIAPDGRIQPPDEVVRQLRKVHTVDVEITLRPANSRLDERTVSAREIEQIAAAQRLGTEIVEFVLCGEGSIGTGSDLSLRLQHLSPTP